MLFASLLDGGNDETVQQHDHLWGQAVAEAAVETMGWNGLRSWTSYTGFLDLIENQTVSRWQFEP